VVHRDAESITAQVRARAVVQERVFFWFRRTTILWAGSVISIVAGVACSVYDREMLAPRGAGQDSQPDVGDTAGSSGVPGAAGGAGVMGGAGDRGTSGAAGAAGANVPGVSDGASEATGGEGLDGAAEGGGRGTTDAGGANDGRTATGRACPVGQFVTGIDSAGNLSCADLDVLTRTTINESCSVYSGWRDSCPGCVDPPVKWGWASGTSCQNGGGTDNTCAAVDLGGISIQSFGLNPDGTVDINDKFFTGLHCAAPSGADGQATGTCPAGQFVTGRSGAGLTCTSGPGAVLTYVRAHCSIYLGWRDNCGNCTTPPDRWGRANDDSCDVGIGPGNSCTPASLGTESVNLFGMNTGGVVDGNDKFYVAFHCAGAPGDAGPTSSICPAGQLVTAVNGNETIQCASGGAAIERYARQHCFVYAGWRDSCNACTTAPAKWGRVNDTICENGVGLNDTCSDATLGTESVRLFGLNTEGAVNDDDKFYAGFRCE
jgi:hypothetical protein